MGDQCIVEGKTVAVYVNDIICIDITLRIEVITDNRI